MRRLIALMAVMALPGLAAAHDGHDQGAHKLMGTVAAVHAEANHVEMKDSKTGNATDFFVNDKTKIVRGAVEVKLADLKPGTKIVVSGKTEGGKMIASEVKVGAAGKVDKAPAAAHGGHQH